MVLVALFQIALVLLELEEAAVRLSNLTYVYGRECGENREEKNDKTKRINLRKSYDASPHD